MKKLIIFILLSLCFVSKSFAVDTYVIAGQSNAEGRATNAKVYTGTIPSTVFKQEGVSFIPLADHTDIDRVSGGSAWPLVMSSISDSTSTEVRIITTADGSTSSANWTKGQATYERCVATIIASGVTEIKAMLWYQGENDASAGTSQVVYQNRIAQMHSDMQTDTGITFPLYMAKIADFQAFDMTAVRAARDYLVANYSDILNGPDLSGAVLADETHFVSDAEIDVFSDAWIAVLELPVITSISSLVDGQQATVSGYNFDPDETPLPLVFETFDEGINGNVIELQNCSDYGTWQANAFGDFNPIYVNTDQRSPGLSSYHYMETAEVDPQSHADMWIKFSETHQPVVQISFYYRFVPVNGTATTLQVKTWRMLNDGAWTSDSNSSWFENWLEYQIPNVKNLVVLHNDTTQSMDFPPTPPLDTTLNCDLVEGAWTQIFLRLKQGTVDTEDGQIRYKNGDFLYSTDVANTYIANTDWQRLMLGYFIGEGFGTETYDSSVEIQFDDIQVSDTWRGVYICDKSTINESDIIEPQITTQRLDGTVTITARKGGLLTDSGFLIIVDSNGFEDSTPITFGTGPAPSGSVSVLNTGTPNKSLNTGISWKVGN